MLERSKAPASLARRVMLLVGLSIILCLGLLGWVIQQAIEQHFADMDGNELTNAAQPLAMALQNQPPTPPISTAPCAALKASPLPYSARPIRCCIARRGQIFTFSPPRRGRKSTIVI